MTAARDAVLEGLFMPLCVGGPALHGGPMLSLGQIIALDYMINFDSWRWCYPALQWWPMGSCCKEHASHPELIDRIYKVKL